MKKHDLALLAGIILIKVLTGTAMGLFGPMLPSLAKNTNVDVTDASWIFSIRSFGIYLGGNIATVGLKKINPILLLLLSGVFQLISLFLIPVATHILLLVCVVLVISIVIGVIDSGGQLLILTHFRRDAAPLIQLFHFVFNVGAILGNTVVALFVEPSGETPCEAEETLDQLRG
jgi:MFS family permease